MSTLRIIPVIALLVLPTLAFAQAAEEQDDIARLEQRIQALEKKLEAGFARIERKLDQMGSGEAKEKAAAASLGEINQLVARGDIANAKVKMAAFNKEFAGTQTARRALSVSRELDVFGKDAPASLEVEKWYQGDASFSDGKATLLVFWESWCPHCQREVPKMEALHTNFKDKGLQVVGLTKITRSSTEEKVQEFIQTQNISYPMAKEKDGSMSQYFNVSGIPAAAVVKEGKVVWRGHPARLTQAMIEGWL